jgi:hypothetical protein
MIAPTAAERALLRFLVPGFAYWTRVLLAVALFVAGTLLMIPAPWLGALVVLVGHLPLWVRTQRTAPGGSTPEHEEVWAPTTEDWLERVEKLEERARRWDTTPWDISNARGALVFLGLLLALAAVTLAGSLGWWGSGLRLGGLGFRLFLLGLCLFVPVWFNGMRTIWNPSELQLKGRALRSAVRALESAGLADLYEVVPMLALREGKRGNYPVDARLMLRRPELEECGFIGIQVQVALNNVRGRDYPYVYCVVLGKAGFPFPRRPRRKGKVVFERGEAEGVEFMVVRNHATRSGGWHTGPRIVRRLVEQACAVVAEACGVER